MKNTYRLFLIISGLAMTWVPWTAADEHPTLKSLHHDAIGQHVSDQFGDDSLLAALLDGTPKLQLRLAYEFSDFDEGGTRDPAEGLSLRLRLSYRTGKWMGASAFVQWQNKSNLVEDFLIPGGRGGDPNHDVIAENDGNRVHQAYLDVESIPDTRVRLGTQEIVLDDSRLIGNVGWRLNAQSFTGVSVRNQSIENLTLFGAWIEKVHNIHLEELPEIESLILLNAKYKFADPFVMTLFGYFLDHDVAITDSVTWGSRVTGDIEAFKYDITVATQDDYADSSTRDGDMLNALVSYKLDAVTLGVGYSYISGGTGTGDTFETLFSTAHKFNGWADQFLATNSGGAVLDGGLQDYWIQAAGKVDKLKWLVAYHFFDTTDTRANGFDGDYGTELDVVLKYPICNYTNASLKYSWYDEGDDSALNPTADEQVLWARLDINF